MNPIVETAIPIYDPTVEPEIETEDRTNRDGVLAGKRIGLLWNSKVGADKLMRYILDELKEDGAPSNCPKNTTPDRRSRKCMRRWPRNATSPLPRWATEAPALRAGCTMESSWRKKASPRPSSAPSPSGPRSKWSPRCAACRTTRWLISPIP